MGTFTMHLEEAMEIFITTAYSTVSLICAKNAVNYNVDFLNSLNVILPIILTIWLVIRKKTLFVVDYCVFTTGLLWVKSFTHLKILKYVLCMLMLGFYLKVLFYICFMLL